MSKKGFTKPEPSSGKGKTDVWLTPLDWLKELGQFDCDPCGFQGHATAKRLILLPSDGLSERWNGRVFLNPPYSKVEEWLDLAFEKYLSKEISSCVALVFARLDAKWAQKHLRLWDHVLFLQGRMSFLSNSTMQEDTNAGAPSMLLYLGEQPIKNNIIRGVIL